MADKPIKPFIHLRSKIAIGAKSVLIFVAICVLFLLGYFSRNQFVLFAGIAPGDGTMTNAIAIKYGDVAAVNIVRGSSATQNTPQYYLFLLAKDRLPALYIEKSNMTWYFLKDDHTYYYGRLELDAYFDWVFLEDGAVINTFPYPRK